MSLKYKAVGWNRQKKIYDGILIGAVGAYLVIYLAAGLVLFPLATAETLLIRAFGSAAILLLHVILSIGPLCRLDPRFLPLLYNRRHMGVTMFTLALAHAGLAIFQFHALGNMNPFVSVLSSNTRVNSLSEFPFEWFGVIALLILFLMAATSHDFWLANLTAPVWKTLHMAVYVAYASVILHVVLGILQAEASPLMTSVLGAGMVWIISFHLIAGWRERHMDAGVASDAPTGGEFVDVCGVDEIPDNRARIFTLTGERVAVFKYDGKISAISNVCQHQNGPLGEGCVIAGLVTCPWHGYQYRPEDGASPPPFTEKVPTFNIKVQSGRVFVDPKPNAAGTRVEPVRIA